MLTTHQKYITEQSNTSIKFGFPYRKLWVVIFGISFSLITTIAFFVLSFSQIFIPEMAIFPLVIPPSFFLIIAPIVLFMLVELLWLLRGQEVVRINKSQIVIEHQIFGLGISRKINADNIDGVFVSRQKNDWLTYSSRGSKFLDFRKGMVAVNSGKTLFGGTRTFRFGSKLDKGEAQQIVTTIHKQFPQYQYRQSPKTG